MSVLAAITQFDRRVVHATGRLRRPRLVGVVRWVSRSGDGYVPLGCIVLASLGDSPEASRFLSVALISFGIERVLYVVAKRFFKRKRPAETLPRFVAATAPADRFSFPSGHTMAAFLTAYLVVSLLGVSALLAYSWAAAVGCSRVLLGVHYPSDIVAGGALGLAVGWFALGLIG